MRALLLFSVAALLAARPAAAQWMVGAGYGDAFTGKTSGRAWHAQVNVPLVPPRVSHTHGEVYAFAQQGNTSGSPMACERVRQVHCFGRGDRSTLVGAGVSFKLDRSYFEGRLRAYSRGGLGVYHQRLTSTEQQGAVPICFDAAKEIVTCQNVPPAGSLTFRGAHTGPGITAAVGLRFRVLRMEGFADVGTHVARIDGGLAGGMPITLGIAL